MVENSEYVRFARRIMRALSRRAGGDIDTLPDLLAIQAEINALMAASVAACRAEGYSWGDIAQRLGTTRQNAQQRYGRTDASAAAKRQAVIDGQLTIDGTTTDDTQEQL